MTPDGITPNNELKTQGSYGGEELEREIGYIVNLRGEERRPYFPAVAFARKANASGRWPMALLFAPALAPRRGAPVWEGVGNVEEGSTGAEGARPGFVRRQLWRRRRHGRGAAAAQRASDEARRVREGLA